MLSKNVTGIGENELLKKKKERRTNDLNGIAKRNCFLTVQYSERQVCTINVKGNLCMKYVLQ